RTQTDGGCVDRRGLTMAWLAHDRIRTPPTGRDPQRAQSRSRRANRADRKSKCHRIPNSFIQHESDLTTDSDQVVVFCVDCAIDSRTVPTSPGDVCPRCVTWWQY